MSDYGELVLLIVPVMFAWLAVSRAKLAYRDLRDGVYRHAPNAEQIVAKADDPVHFWFGLGSRLFVVVLSAAFAVALVQWIFR